jgi:hypothetical protein
MGAGTGTGGARAPSCPASTATHSFFQPSPSRSLLSGVGRASADHVAVAVWELVAVRDPADDEPLRVLVLVPVADAEPVPVDVPVLLAVVEGDELDDSDTLGLAEMDGVDDPVLVPVDVAVTLPVALLEEVDVSVGVEVAEGRGVPLADRLATSRKVQPLRRLPTSQPNGSPRTCLNPAKQRPQLFRVESSTRVVQPQMCDRARPLRATQPTAHAGWQPAHTNAHNKGGLKGSAGGGGGTRNIGF